MITTQEKAQAITEACIKANPEIVALKFGCVIGFNKRKYQYKSHRDSIHILGKYWIVVHDSFGERLDTAVEIIGRPIRLADVFLAYITVGHSIDGKGVYNIFANWKLGEDDLSKQDESTIDFIHNLMCHEK